MTQQSAVQTPVAAEKRTGRPWYFWVLLVLWIGLLVALVQNALASAAELEPRAAMLFWIMTGVVLLAGLVIMYVRRSRSA
jgi:uncharacterized membrane protein YhaH (DUF805 family)